MVRLGPKIKTVFWKSQGWSSGHLPPASHHSQDGVVHVRPLVCLVCRVGACEQQVVRHRQSLVMEAARAPSTTGLLELPAGSVSKIQDREECRPVTLECQINMEGVL